MTRQIRKKILIGATTAAQLVLLLHLVTLLYIYLTLDSTTMEHAFRSVVPTGNVNMLMLNLSIQASICGGSLLGLYLFFRKTPSAEVLFFQFALLGFALTSLRVLTIPLSLHLTSLFSLQPFSKLILFGRLFGVLCLFLSGLFSAGLNYHKQGGYLIIAFIAAMLISTLLPLDCTSYSPPLVCSLGKNTGFTIAYYLMGAFAVINYVYAASLHSSREYTFNAVGLLFVFVGAELSYNFAHLPIGMVGGFCMIMGTIVFAQRTHAIYQWF